MYKHTNINDNKIAFDSSNNIINDLNIIMDKMNNMFYNINNKINDLNSKLEKNNLNLNNIIKEFEKKKSKLTKKNKEIKENKQNKIFKSASLIFIDDEMGNLMCEEYRYKEKKNLIHPIGGKVEIFDNGLIETAIREFIEETNLEEYPYKYINKSSKDVLIDSIKNIINSKINYYDLCLNKDYGYYHRYYLYDLKFLEESIELDEFKKSILKLPEYFNGNFKTEVNYLNWYKINNEKKNISYLTKIFFKHKKNKVY